MNGEDTLQSCQEGLWCALPSRQLSCRRKTFCTPRSGTQNLPLRRNCRYLEVMYVLLRGFMNEIVQPRVSATYAHDVADPMWEDVFQWRQWWRKQRVNQVCTVNADPHRDLTYLAALLIELYAQKVAHHQIIPELRADGGKHNGKRRHPVMLNMWSPHMQKKRMNSFSRGLNDIIGPYHKLIHLRSGMLFCRRSREEGTSI